MPQDTAERIEAAEDASQETLNFVMGKIRATRGLGRPLDVAGSIYGQHRERHARHILTGALVMAHGAYSLDHTKILNSLRAIDRCGAYDFEAMEEFWSLIEDTAREMARDCRERAGDLA